MPGSIQSIERAAAALRLLAASPGRLGLAELAASLALSKGTAHGILRTLREVGFVEQAADGRYGISPSLGALRADYLDDNELRARSMNWADPLAASTGEESRVAVLREREVLIVHHVFRPVSCPQTIDTGSRRPPHTTALGKVLLAHHPASQPPPDAHLPALTRATVTSGGVLRGQLARVLADGFAVTVGERTPACAEIAAAVRGRGGLVVAAVGIEGHRDRVCDPAGAPRPQLVAAVRHCAAAITRALAVDRVPR